MKKLLLLSGLFLSSFYASAQLGCSTAKDISAQGIFTVPIIAGANQSPDQGGCVQAPTTAAGGDLKGYWCKYVSATPGKVTISSNLETNVAPKSDNTLLTVMVGNCTALSCYDFSDDVSSTNKLSQVSFIAEGGVTYYIMWSNYYSSAGFDFEVSVNPCVEPEILYLPTNVTTTSATLSWEPALGNPAQYEVVLINAKDITTETSVIVNTNKADLTGLDPQGNYYFFLRSVCSVDEGSDFTGPFLLPLLKEVPYASNFDTLNDEAPWTFSSLEGIAFALIKSVPEVAQSSPNFWAFFNDPAFVSNNWLYSPGISMKKDQKINVSFYVASNSAVDNRSFKITIGTQPTEVAQTTTLISNTTLKTQPYTKVTTPDYTVTEDGVYYIGVNDFSGLSTIVDGEGNPDASFVLFDTFSVNQGTLTVEDFFSKQFSVFPNPANDVISITNSADINVNAISIVDFNGRVIKKEKFENISNINVKVSDLANGVYIMNIISNQGTATKKFIKN